MSINQYDTLAQALDDLKRKGFSDDFEVIDDKLRNVSRDKDVDPNDLQIVEYHRFEGISNPDDMSIVYVVESKDGSKGTIVDAYGMYSNPVLDELLKKSPVTEG